VGRAGYEFIRVPPEFVGELLQRLYIMPAFSLPTKCRGYGFFLILFCCLTVLQHVLLLVFSGFTRDEEKFIPEPEPISHHLLNGERV